MERLPNLRSESLSFYVIETKGVTVYALITLAEWRSKMDLSGGVPGTIQRRVDGRGRMLKAGSIFFGGTTLTCTVLDLSTSGARLAFGTPVALPTSFTLQLRDGSTYPSVRRWTRGSQVGVAFTAPPAATGNPGQTRRAAEALEALRTLSSIDPAGILRTERFFGDEHLRKAVEAFEAAYEVLTTTLKPHASRLAAGQHQP
jgi:hypothetical protein